MEAITGEMRDSVEVLNTNEIRGKADTQHAHISVLDDGEWVGDFYASFHRRVRHGEVTYAADWTDVKGGNGIYVDDDPTFWPVEVAAEQLNETTRETFQAINSGPTDI